MYFFHSVHVWELLRPQDIMNDVFNMEVYYLWFLMAFVQVGDTYTDVAQTLHRRCQIILQPWMLHIHGCKIIWPTSFYGRNLSKQGYTSTCFTMATTLCSVGMMLTQVLNQQNLIGTWSASSKHACIHYSVKTTSECMVTPVSGFTELMSIL